MRLQRLPALTGAGVSRADSIVNPVDVDDDDDGRAKRARVTVTVDDENARVRVEVSDASMSSAARLSTPVTHHSRPVTHHQTDGWGVHAVVRAALELHARIPPASLYTVLGVAPDPAGAFASLPYPWLRDAGFKVPDTFSNTSGDSRPVHVQGPPTRVARTRACPADGAWSRRSLRPSLYAARIARPPARLRTPRRRHVEPRQQTPRRQQTPPGVRTVRRGVEMGHDTASGAPCSQTARYAGEWSRVHGRVGHVHVAGAGGASYVGSFRANERAGLGIDARGSEAGRGGLARGVIETPMTASCGGGDGGGGGARARVRRR